MATSDPLGYYDRDGKPIDLWTWAELFEHSDRFIGETFLGTYRVSTMWIGLNTNWGSGPPLIFETMVFATDTPYDLDCRRYATEEQARAGHEELVTLLRATVQTADDVLPNEAPISEEQR